MLLQVTGTFLLCWTPLDVMLVMLVLVGPELWLLLLFEGAFLLAMTSFLLNPFVYAWKTEVTRRPLISLLGRLGLGLRPGQRAGVAEDGRGRAVFAIAGGQSSVSISNSSSGASAASNQTSRVDVP